MKWFEQYVNTVAPFHRASITASYHREHVNTQEKREQFADKLCFAQEWDVQVTINQVMVPEQFDELYERCCRFSERGINVTLKPQSDPTASFIVDGYSVKQHLLMQQQFPQHIQGEKVMQMYFEDAKGNNYGLDQAERMNAFDFNKFKGWTCAAGYQSCVIRGVEVKRAYSCAEEPLGTLTGGFTLFKAPSKCVTSTCVSSADSKIPKELK